MLPILTNTVPQLSPIWTVNILKTKLARNLFVCLAGHSVISVYKEVYEQGWRTYRLHLWNMMALKNPNRKYSSRVVPVPTKAAVSVNHGYAYDMNHGHLITIVGWSCYMSLI